MSIQNIAPLQNEAFMPVFEEILDWQLSVVRRYPAASLAVIVVEPQLDDIESGSARDARLAEFNSALRHVIRASDMTARGGRHEVWLMLPHSDAQGALARLKAEFVTLAASVRLDSAAINLRHGKPLPESAAQLMGDLRRSLP